MANRFRQFRLLLWKNFILQIRRPIGTTFEIIVPLVMIAILILPKLLLKPEDPKCFSSFKPLSSMMIKKGLLVSQDLAKLRKNVSSNNSLVLAFYPTGEPVASLMSKVSSITGLKVVNKSVAHKGKDFSSLDLLISEAAEHEELYMGVVVFDVEENKPLPKKVKYTIRLPHNEPSGNSKTWRTSRTYPNFQSVGPRSESRYKERFVPIQYAVDMAIIQQKTNMPSPIPLDIQQFPYPSYTVDEFAATISGLLPLLLTLAFIYSAVSIVKELVFEKQQRLKESMKMMGLANWIHWLAWYIKCLLFLLISVVLATAIIKGFKIFENSNGFLVFLFFLLYIMAAISYCFLISVFFSNPTLSMLFGSVLWYASYIPYQVFAQSQQYDELSRSAKAAMCLLPNSAVGIGAILFSRLESLKVGITFDTINQPSSPDDTFTMAWVMGMMLISNIIYLTLAWYIEAVFPGKFGIPKPFYFPFLKSYWCGYSHDDIIEANDVLEDEEDAHHNHDVEDEPTDLEIGVGIKKLRKVFKGATGAKVAVDGLSLNMYKGQITALLGHNGAGKTTTMSILTGLFPPTSGSAHVGNKSILTDIEGIRESLGLCPQHNVLFDRLTVKEHLEFFVNLKGKYGQTAKDEVMQMITDMQLLDKTNEKSSTLSGGMKRKLSCAIALVGGSETVFLDEPTSGMDPYARRATWDLLLKYKAGKTIILTTHFMDEADFLGDRIAIMADGQLRCCGSSLFLKSRYGVGYHLTLVKKEDFNENATIKLLKRAIPSTEILSNVGAEIEFVLNKEAAKSFQSLFLELETKRDEYGIASFGVSVTTMEEVFMKVGEGSEKTVEDIVSDHEHHRDTDNIINMPNNEEPDMGELLKGLPLKLQQYKAMLFKRFLNSKRDKKAVVTQLLLPLVMVLFGLLIISSSPSATTDPARALTLSNLSTGGSNTRAFYADFNQAKNDMQIAKDHLKTVNVDVQDVLSKVDAVYKGNSNDSITVRGKTVSYQSPTNDTETACCDYEFLILNTKCKNDFLKGSLTAKTCAKKDTFGYKYCQKCLLNCQDSDAPTVNGTSVEDMNQHFSEYVLEQSNARDYFNKYVAGFTFGPPVKILPPSNITNTSKPTVVTPKTMSTVWYSNQGYHTIAEALNAMSNILLQQNANADHTIETTNFPLPNSVEDKVNNVGADVGVLLLCIFMAMGMAFMAASFITFIVNERTSKAKHLQFVSGVDSVSYWFGSFTWDYINYLIPAIAVLILIAAFQLDELKDDLGTVFLMLLLFGFCVLPFIYVLSFIFTSPLIAYALTVFILSILSLGMLIAVFVCRIPGLDAEKEAEIMHYVFMLFPTYTLSISLNDMASNFRNRRDCTATPEAKLACTRFNLKYTDNSLSWDMPGVGQEALYMFIEGLVLFLLTVLIQVKFFIGIASKKSAENAAELDRYRSEDADVHAERQRVHKLTKEQIEKQSVVIRDLTKVYGGSDRTAVDHLCIGIPKGECFGLLGVNGAGKTTTFSMLTGDQSITEGSAYLCGYNLQTQLRQVQQRIGYCPQFDALIERMTGREMLTMYAQLRGVRPSKIKDIVSSTISKLNLGKWADKLCGNYSGGNKRKLSTAIALVGDPPIVFLDEPTSGMDPVARRFLWDSLTQVMKGGRSIVLTSHSMEECEALCTRLAIMVNGQFKCVGSTQHLKSRFGTGYTIMIKVKNNNINGSIATASQVTPIIPNTAAYDNPVVNPSLPEVHDPGHPYDNPAMNGHTTANPPAYPMQNAVGQQPSVQVVPQPAAAYPQQVIMPLSADAAAVSRAKAFIEETFRGAVLMDAHGGMLTYQVVNDDLTWSQIFGHLEKNREVLGIVDYSVSQTTLEQVFINFAKDQHSEERTKVKRKCGCLPC